MKLALLLLFLLALSVSGCAGSFEEARAPKRLAAAPPSSARCITLDDRHTFWGGAGKFSAALSGASGLSTFPVKDESARISLAASSAGLAAVAVGASFIAESASESWARECAAP